MNDTKKITDHLLYLLYAKRAGKTRTYKTNLARHDITILGGSKIRVYEDRATCEMNGKTIVVRKHI